MSALTSRASPDVWTLSLSSEPLALSAAWHDLGCNCQPLMISSIVRLETPRKACKLPGTESSSALPRWKESTLIPANRKIKSEKGERSLIVLTYCHFRSEKYGTQVSGHILEDRSNHREQKRPQFEQELLDRVLVLEGYRKKPATARSRACQLPRHSSAMTARCATPHFLDDNLGATNYYSRAYSPW